MTERATKTVWSGEFRVGSLVLKCHVLDDGRRVIDAASMADFIEWLADPAVSQEDVARFGAEVGAWVQGKDQG